jgi:hypothetical protein
MSSSNQPLRPDIEELIEILMRFFEERKRHPILLACSDDDERLLEWKDGNL